jgi:hypothetical protein
LLHSESRFQSVADAYHLQAVRDFRKEMRNATARTKLTQPKNPFTTHRRVKQSAEPQQPAKIGMVDYHAADGFVRKGSHRASRKRRPVMVELTHRLAMQADKIAGDIKRDQLAAAVEPIHITADEPVDEEHAAFDTVAVSDDVTANLNRQN